MGESRIDISMSVRTTCNIRFRANPGLYSSLPASKKASKHHLLRIMLATGC